MCRDCHGGARTGLGGRNSECAAVSSCACVEHDATDHLANVPICRVCTCRDRAVAATSGGFRPWPVHGTRPRRGVGTVSMRARVRRWRRGRWQRPSGPAASRRVPSAGVCECRIAARGAPVCLTAGALHLGRRCTSGQDTASRRRSPRACTAPSWPSCGGLPVRTACMCVLPCGVELWCAPGAHVSTCCACACRLRATGCEHAVHGVADGPAGCLGPGRRRYHRRSDMRMLAALAGHGHAP